MRCGNLGRSRHSWACCRSRLSVSSGNEFLESDLLLSFLIAGCAARFGPKPDRPLSNPTPADLPFGFKPLGDVSERTRVGRVIPSASVFDRRQGDRRSPADRLDPDAALLDIVTARAKAISSLRNEAIEDCKYQPADKPGEDDIRKEMSAEGDPVER